MSSFVEILGGVTVALNFVSAFAIVSQIRLTWRRKNTIGLSFLPWLMASCNSWMGLAYSLVIGNTVFTIANLAWATVNTTMLGLILIYRRRTDSINLVREQ